MTLRNGNRLVLAFTYETTGLLLLSLAVKWKHIFTVNRLLVVFPV